MKPELLFGKTVEELAMSAGPHLKDAAQQVVFIKMVRELDSSIDQLRSSMEATAKSNDVLSGKVHRLNVILTWATVAGSIAAMAAVIVAALQLLK